MTANTWIKAGAIALFIAVALGAFGAHGLKDVLDDYEKNIFETGVRYQMIHGLALFVVAWIVSQSQNNRAAMAGYLFLAGILIFSGSLYAIALTGIRKFGMITPLGGLSFLVGWILIAMSHV